MTGNYQYKTRQSLLKDLDWSSETNSTPLSKGSLRGSQDKQYLVTRDNRFELLGRTNKIDIGGIFINQSIKLRGAGSYRIGNVFNLHYFGGGSPALFENWEGTLFASGEVKDIFARIIQNDEASKTYVTSRCPILVPDANLDELGATAVSRVLPTNPSFDAATNVAEIIREGFPSLPGKNGNIGSEYLNYEFGIKPIASGAQEAYEAAKNADELLEQLERDSGRLIRRSYNFPPTESTSTLVETGKVPGINGGSPSGKVIIPGKRTTTTITKSRTWFSGAFTYHIPSSGWRRKVYELDRLYGILPGIDTAWELMPWSWLVDYKTNIGDVMKNLNAFGNDGLVMPYGYIMNEQRSVKHITWQGRVKVDNVFQDATISDEIHFVTQQRRPANPYGFGITDDALSDRQKLILAALGLSKL